MIRERKEEDTETIVEVWYSSFSLAHPFIEDSFKEKVKKDMRELYIPNAETWIYEENEVLIGFISMLGNEIGGLFVEPDHHSKGIGSLLLKHVSELHEELEVEVFEKNLIGRAFYDKSGFKQIKQYTHAETNCEMLRMSTNPTISNHEI